VRLQPHLMAPKMTKYIPHKPEVKQAAFLLLPHIEAFYGGEPGGGKSDALLMGALQYVDVPGYAAILFRRTFADLALPGALMDRAHQWLNASDARWSEQRKTWTFPSGATLTFGYLENEKDKYRYQSTAFQYIGWDELSQFYETQYTYLFSRLRRLVGQSVPLRVRSASNPPTTAEGQWVKSRFVLERNPRRPFIPAGLSDNPHIDRAEYMESLSHLDSATYASLFDWFASVEGLVFGEFNDGNLTDEEPNPGRDIVLAIDDGYFPDPRVTLFIQNKGTHLLVFDEMVDSRVLEEQTVDAITARCNARGLRIPTAAAVSHESPQLRARLKGAGIPARSWLETPSAGASTRVAAIKLTRSMFCDAQKRRTILVNRRCKHLVWEITQGYRYPEGRHGADDKPADANDHACEALESLVWMLYGPQNERKRPRSKEY
jgi:hypothetical protein